MSILEDFWKRSVDASNVVSQNTSDNLKLLVSRKLTIGEAML